MFAIVPSLQPHHGDMRRIVTPYFVTTGVTYGDLNTANSAMRKLNALGHKCHLEVIV